MSAHDMVTGLSTKSVLVVGCGGLGGYVAELLARVGLARLYVMDGDVFSVGNLNRQLYSSYDTLGQNKALTFFERATGYGDTDIIAVPAFFTAENATEYISKCDLVVDATDNIAARLLLEDTAEQAGIPLVHGAINGMVGQITCVYPGDKTLHSFYEGQTESAAAETVSYVPALIASLEVSEAVKILSGVGTGLRGKMLLVDTLFNEFRELDITK